jgi:hypothetical protein
MASWAFCEVENIEAELKNRVPFDVSHKTEIQGFMDTRAAQIRTVLQTRGLTAVSTWKSSYTDVWDLLKLANTKGAAADTEAALFTGAGSSTSERAERLLAEFKELLDLIGSASLPGLTDAAAVSANLPTSYAQENTDDDTVDAEVTRDLEF